jgi:hypothetical protein
MKWILSLVLGLSLISQLAQAQSQRNPCYYTTTGITSCQPVGTSVTGVANGPLPVGGIANAAAPTFVEGKVGGLSFDLTGNLRTTGGGGGGGAATIANGADVAEGSTTDVPATVPTDATAATTIALLKALNNSNVAPVPAGTNNIGTFTLPSGASTSALQTIGNTALATINTTLGTPFQAGGSIGNTSFGAVLAAETTKVIGTVNQGTTPWVVTSTSTGKTIVVPSSSSADGITPIVSTAGEASHVLKAGAGNSYAAYATNLTATQGFLLLLNSTTAPADGAVTPLACAPLAPNGIASISYSPGPPGVFSTGITAVVTSAVTCFTKTTGVITAFISGSVQ